MPTSFDPDTAVSGGLLGANGPVQVTFGPCSVDYFDYTDKSGKVVARTVAALIGMSPDGETDEQGNPKCYIQMYSVGDPKTHHPNPDKASFEGTLLKGSNFNFLLENVINSGFPKHLLAPGNIHVLNGVVAVVEQKAPPKRNIQGQPSDAANKPQVVPVKIIHPAPGEEWPANGKPVAANVGGKKPPVKKAPVVAPPVPAAAPPAIPAADNQQVSALAEAIVGELTVAGGEDGFASKDENGSLAKLGAKVTLAYMKRMKSSPGQFPANLRAHVVKLVQDQNWLGSSERPWVYDPETGMLLGS